MTAHIVLPSGSSEPAAHDVAMKNLRRLVVRFLIRFAVRIARR